MDWGLLLKAGRPARRTGGACDGADSPTEAERAAVERGGLEPAQYTAGLALAAAELGLSVVLVGGLLVQVGVALITTGISKATDPRTWQAIHLITTAPVESSLLGGLLALLTLGTYLAHRNLQRERKSRRRPKSRPRHERHSSHSSSPWNSLSP